MSKRRAATIPAFPTMVNPHGPDTPEVQYHMTRVLGLLLAALASGAAMSPSVRSTAPLPRDVKLIGRWDITITTPTGTAPSWLEIDTSGRDAMVGRIVGIVGSVRPISQIIPDGDSLRFAVPHQWEAGDAICGWCSAVKATVSSAG